MFTGIVERVGTIEAIKRSDPTQIELIVASGFEDLTLGESIAINGVCLTATAFTAKGEVRFYAGPETLARTNLGALEAGSKVNLERALTLATRLSGHFVQGHVDGVGKITSITPRGESHEVRVRLPHDLSRYVIAKGSIAIDGVSLTINALADRPGETEISLLLIPHSWKHTRFAELKAGDAVNIEVDVLAKYTERLCQNSLKRLSG